MSFALGIITKEGATTPAPTATIDYLPFGVKTVKVVVTGDYQGKLQLRPLRFSAIAGEKFGHEDGTELPDFVVSWGGGHEEYYELDYPKKKVAYFLLHHTGQPVAEAILTIMATDEADGTSQQLPVSLHFPTSGGPWDPADLVRARWEERQSGLDGAADILLEGTFTPAYIARWWPTGKVSYSFRSTTPRVRIHYQRRVGGANGRLTIHLAKADHAEERAVAVIDGSIAYPLYDMQQIAAELYRFGGRTWVLRLWFFWLDLELSREDLGRHWLQPADIDAAWEGITKDTVGGQVAKSWAELHEVPDAERVDLLFNDELEILAACTDLHWRELWGMFTPTKPKELLRAEIMNTRMVALANNHKALWQVVKGWGSVILAGLTGGETPYMPHKAIASELKREGDLAANAVQMESHTPAFHNWTVALRYTSTDVTEG